LTLAQDEILSTTLLTAAASTPQQSVTACPGCIPAAGQAHLGQVEDNASRINSSLGFECWLVGWFGAGWH